MPEDEKKEDGRVVYSRRAEAEGDGFANALAEGAGEFASALMHDSLWRTLLPLFVGFALLVGLVFGLGYRSAGELALVGDPRWIYLVHRGSSEFHRLTRSCRWPRGLLLHRSRSHDDFRGLGSVHLA